MEGKRSTSANNSSSSSCEILKKQKRQISIATFNKWQSLYNREHDSLLWLRCDKDREDKDYCFYDVCKKYESSITGLKNFSRVWIDGSLNHRVSNVLDHATSIQLKAAMVRFNKDVGKRDNPRESHIDQDITTMKLKLWLVTGKAQATRRVIQTLRMTWICLRKPLYPQF